MTSIHGMQIGAYLQQAMITVVPFIILLGVLVFVHELGHFLVAKWVGVRVEVFSLGFGKKILRYVRGGTTYCISLIPLGGYVKMFGDEIGAPVSEAERKYAFLHKKIWERIAIAIAGPLMNLFFAILVFSVLSITGEEFKSPYLGDIGTKTLAYAKGFRSGDKLLKVDDQDVRSWDDVERILDKSTRREIPFVVKREVGDQILTILATPTEKPNPNILSMKEFVGSVEGFTTVSTSAMVGVIFNSIAYKAGFRTGDRIAAINGSEVKYFREVENILLPLQSHKALFRVERYSPEGSISETLSIELDLGTFSSVSVLGLERSEFYLSKVLDKSPAQRAGLLSGDRLLKVDSVVPEKWEEILATVKGYKGENPLKFEVERDGKAISISVNPEMTQLSSNMGEEEKRYTVGIYPWLLQAPIKTITLRVNSFSEALQRGWTRTGEVTRMTLVSFLKIIQNKISHKVLGGVFSIGQAASDSFKTGMYSFFSLMGLFSIQLFILNLLPIPILDGGHILFYTIEALRGAPLSLRQMEIAQQIGLVLLLSLMALALFNDFSRMFGF